MMRKNQFARTNRTSFFSSKRFVVQLIFVFLLFTLGTVIGLGVPVSWLLNRQTDQQLHALIDQSSQTTLALIENKSIQLQNLALLLVGRPTLNQLINEGGNEQIIYEYLDGFLKNAVADGLLICQSGKIIASTSQQMNADFCDFPNPEAFIATGNQVWLISKATQKAEEGSQEIQVIVGQHISSILQEFHTQSGLDYLIFQDGKQLVTNLGTNMTFEEKELSPPFPQYKLLTMDDNGSSINYLSTTIPLPQTPEFQLIGLLNIESYSEFNRQLRNVIIGTLSAISLIGAVLAIVVSRRISRPINQLARSAAALREGDLTTPLTTTANIWEISQLTNALEDARVSLKHTMSQLRREKTWIVDLLDSIVEGLLTIDDDARITFASKSINNMIGGDANSLIGRSIDHYLISPSGEELFSHQIPGLNQSRKIPVVINEKEILLSVSASEFVPPEAGNATRALVIRDVTDEERIHKLIGEFMANITHEFRTPLTALSASVELLIDQLPSLSSDEIETLLSSLNIGIVNLQALIDNLIEAASIEAGRFKINPKPIELSIIINEAVETIEPIAEKHIVHIIQPKQKQSFEVLADRRRTVQALLNLLSNAIKHSPENGKIIIRTLILKNNVMVEVHDEGTGISPDFQKHLFNRFISPEFTEDSSNLGLGLGLSVVKAIIEAQDGEVGFRNKENNGALFWFTLPMLEGKS